MALIAILYYENEKKLYFDLSRTKVQNFASILSSKIIQTHMSGEKRDIKGMLFDDTYTFSLYDKSGILIYGDIKESLDFSKKIIEKKNYFIYIDNSTYNHLGVSYIAVKDESFYNWIDKLKYNILILFSIFYLIISAIGFFLARLFLKPIKDEREKLNNFIKDTTHELNTPISAILMSLEKDELSKKQIERIKLAANKISEIYKDLTYLFLEDKDINKDIKIQNLDEIIEEELKYFEHLALKKSIKIHCSVEKFSYKIDRNDFIRLFNNVVSNAIKYNKKNGEIEIVLKEKKLIIRDTGIGIEKDKLNDIFKRYYRATKQSGGFGIGLNIVQNICNDYNISFKVDSKLQEGTSFSFTF